MTHGKKISLALIVSTLLISCEYKDVPPTFTAGTYKGTLSIVYAAIDYPLLNATLTVTASRFSIQIRDAYYPDRAITASICDQGTYKITEQEIEFTTDCTEPPGAWSWYTAINGKFQLRIINKQIEMTKAGEPAVTYKLTLQ